MRFLFISFALLLSTSPSNAEQCTATIGNLANAGKQFVYASKGIDSAGNLATPPRERDFYFTTEVIGKLGTTITATESYKFAIAGTPNFETTVVREYGIRLTSSKNNRTQTMIKYSEPFESILSSLNDRNDVQDRFERWFSGGLDKRQSAGIQQVKFIGCETLSVLGELADTKVFDIITIENEADNGELVEESVRRIYWSDDLGWWVRSISNTPDTPLALDLMAIEEAD